MTRARLLALLLPLALAPLTATAAPGAWHKGDLSIRYNALPASMLPAQSLKPLGVDDPAHTGLLNILVTRGTGADVTSVTADISARAMTDTGSPVTVHVQEIHDANGTSYVGVFRLDHTTTLRFDLDITPRGAATQHIHFEHTVVIE